MNTPFLEIETLNHSPTVQWPTIIRPGGRNVPRGWEDGQRAATLGQSSLGADRVVFDLVGILEPFAMRCLMIFDI